MEKDISLDSMTGKYLLAMEIMVSETYRDSAKELPRGLHSEGTRRLNLQHARRLHSEGTSGEHGDGIVMSMSRVVMVSESRKRRSVAVSIPLIG